LNSPQNVQAMNLLMKWFTQDKILPAEPSTALITSLFNGGKAAIVFSGPWFLGEIANGIDYGLALLPTLDEAGGKPMRPWMTVEGVYIASPSKNKDAAYDFAKFITDVPAAKVMALQGRQTPSNKAVYADKDVAADAVLQAFRKQVDVAIPMPNLAEMTMVWSPATTAMNTVTKRAATPQQALDAAQKKVEADIAGLRKHCRTRPLPTGSASASAWRSPARSRSGSPTPCSRPNAGSRSAPGRSAPPSSGCAP
jgi:arabinogalactan oligomer/maltooligosaccharide transport system substrate-binding protein